MHLNRTPFLAGALSVALCANAQYVTLNDQGTVPAIGTSIVMHQGAFTAVPAGGADMSYDFSTIQTIGSKTYVWTAPTISHYSPMFPTATLALNNAGPDTIFYEVNGQGFERVGETRTITVLGSNFPAAYTEPVLELPLPLAFGNTWTDDIAGTFSVEGTTGTRTGTINGVADATGFVTIPGVVAPLYVLRTTTNVFETINLTISGMPVLVTHKRVEVAFRTQFSKLPVFRAVTDSLVSTFGLNQVDNFSEWMDAGTVGVLEHQAASTLDVFPSPADATVELSFDGAATLLTVVDAQGAVVLNKQPRRAQGAMREQVAVGDWPSGIYQALITGADGSRTSKRFVVVH